MLRAFLDKLLIPYRALNHRLDTLNRVTTDLNRTLTLQSERYSDPRHLARFGHKIYSAGDEDGIIAEIFRRVGVTNRFFVEFGVADGMENDSLALMLEGWRGVWLEGRESFVQSIRESFAPLLERRQLALKQAFITAENIESLFAEMGVPAEFDFLSIDIDGNDYWVWKAISQFRPRVVCIEYNASFGPSVDTKLRYDAKRQWSGGTRVFGASLKALERLGRDKGYALVACSYQGTNAFFVREDLANEQFLPPFTSETHFEPPRYFAALYPGHRISPEEIPAFFWEPER